MSSFRIAIGMASCRGIKTNDQTLLTICKQVLEKIDHLKRLSSSQLLNFKNEEQETTTINGKKVTFTTYLENRGSEKSLVVVQAFYPTWRWPNYLSLNGIGKVLAEGVIASTDGTIRDATHQELWDYR